ncbi:MAG: DMT family transporter [Pseudoxanthomonas sp.]
MQNLPAPAPATVQRRMWLGVANGAAAGALWGLVFLAPQLLADFSAMQLAASRYLVYGLVATALLAPGWRRLRSRLQWHEWRALVWLSLLGNIVYYLLLASAVQWAGGASASLIVGLLPVVVTLVGARRAGAVPLRRLLVPLALCLAGVVLVGIEAVLAESDSRSRATTIAGLFCAFGALASWTAYSLYNTTWLERRPDISGHDWSLLTGLATGALALLMVVPAFVLGSRLHLPGDWLRFWGVATAVAVLASVAGNGFWNRASRLLPLTLSGQMIVFETVFALLYGFAWERRLPTLMEVAAIVSLITGVLWCMRAHRGHGVTPHEE